MIKAKEKYNVFSKNCLDLIKQFEGFESHAYPDPQSGGEPYTIGYGFTRVNGRKVQPGDTMSRAEADELFKAIVKKYNDYVLHYVKVPLTQNQEDALTCFVFNIGPWKFKNSTALRRLNKGDYHGGIEAATWWVAPGTRVEKGLRKRRQAEKKLFLGQL